MVGLDQSVAGCLSHDIFQMPLKVFRAVHKRVIIDFQILAFIFGLVYWQQNIDQLGLSNINGSLFLMQTQMTFGFIFNVVMVRQFVLKFANL